MTSGYVPKGTQLRFCVLLLLALVSFGAPGSAFGSLFPKIETKKASFSKLGGKDLTLAISFVESSLVDGTD